MVKLVSLYVVSLQGAGPMDVVQWGVCVLCARVRWCFPCVTSLTVGNSKIRKKPRVVDGTQGVSRWAGGSYPALLTHNARVLPAPEASNY